jgi:thiol-disulfide isomerase/thioredoxin
MIVLFLFSCQSQEKKTAETKDQNIAIDKYEEYRNYIREVSLNLESKKDTILPDLISRKMNSEFRDFTIKYLSKNEGKFSDLKGKVVLIDYWATWCGPCKMISPFIAELKEKFKSEDFIVIGISNEKRITIDEYVEQNGEHYDLTYGDMEFGQIFGVEAYPSFFLFDKEGRLQYAHKGANAYIPKVLEWEIEDLLN